MKARLEAKVDICREAGREEGLSIISVHSLSISIPGVRKKMTHILPHRPHKMSESPHASWFGFVGFL